VKPRGSGLGPIGVFDSGVGGLSVLKAIRAALPGESLLYVADSAHAPYGDREAAFITERAVAVARFLCESDAKALVVACNTATVVAVESLRSRFPIPVIAMEPAIKPAAASTRSGVVAVLATSRTLQSASVARLCRLYAGEARVVLQPCPGLVEQVECGDLDSAQTQRLLSSCIRPVVEAGADTLVLGCTHYPFLSKQIQAVAGVSVRLVDSAEAVARQVQRRISPAAPHAPPRTMFFTTGEAQQAETTMSRLWGTPVRVQTLAAVAGPKER
jgi:glutamate racemase